MKVSETMEKHFHASLILIKYFTNSFEGYVGLSLAKEILMSAVKPPDQKF